MCPVLGGSDYAPLGGHKMSDTGKREPKNPERLAAINAEKNLDYFGNKGQKMTLGSPLLSPLL